MVRNIIRSAAIVVALAGLMVSSGCRHKKYENPINKDTQQPDKVLFDTAIDDVEHGRYERARLTLQTLMNTYDTSEYLAKAKLAVADSWYREGGSHGLAQAEAEYKDFILFYPQMEEAAEAQEKICQMQYAQMDKADRDPLHARRAEDECRQLLVQFPNSKFAPSAQQYLRNVQEILADAEYKVGVFYQTKGSYPAAANRLEGVGQFPLYSRADEALMREADAYQHMGDNFENQQASAYSKLVKDYPLSSHVEEAKSRLKAMNRPVPESDPVALSRQKYDLEHRTKRSLLSTVWGPFASHPNTNTAAKSGSPQMTSLHPTIPASVPAVATGGDTGGSGVTGTTGDSGVTATQVNDTSLIDRKPDARMSEGGGAAAGTAPNATAPNNAAPNAAAAQAASGTEAGATATTPKPAAQLPQNHTGNVKKLTVAQQAKLQKKQLEQQKKVIAAQAKQQKQAQQQQAKEDKKKKKKDSTAPPPQAPAAAPAAAAGGSTTKQ